MERQAHRAASPDRTGPAGALPPGSTGMADLVIRVGSRTDQGVRPNNEDRFVADPQRNLFLVADGMGGQEAGELASGLAAEIIPQVVQDRLAQQEDPRDAVQHALAEANAAIVHAGRNQPAGRRMGTTAVVAVRQADKFYVAGLGDSRAYLIRNGRVDQLTVDHSVAMALELNGTLTPGTGPEQPLAARPVPLPRLRRDDRRRRGAAVHPRRRRPPAAGQRRPDQPHHRGRPARRARRSSPTRRRGPTIWCPWRCRADRGTT